MSQAGSENDNLPFWAALGAAGLCITFGANAVAVKLSLLGIGVFTSAGIRFVIAALVIAGWARATGRSLGFRKDQAFHLILLSMSFVVQMAFFYIGLHKTHASRATLITNLQPFFVLLLAHFFIPGDRITPGKAAGILLGFAGIAALFTDRHAISADLQLGDMATFFAVLCWAATTIYMKRILPGFHSFHLVLYPMVFAGPVFLAIGYALDQPMVHRLDTVVVASMLYQSVVTAAFGFVCWTALLKRYGAVAMNAYIFLLPITGVLLSGLLLKEPVASRGVLTAMVCVSAGILLVHARFSFSRMKG
ncbi:MAG: DMT family transporter [Thermodesulfobacteriota bacterium]